MATIECPDEIFDELARIVGRENVEKAASEALRREVRRLSAALLKPPGPEQRVELHPRQVVNPHGRRHLVERVALRARHAVRRDGQHRPHWTPDQLRAISETPPYYFVDEAVAGAATALDGPATTQLAPAMQALLDSPLPPDEVAIKYSEVARALGKPKRVFVARFTVAARVPLAKNYECTPPFGGATRIQLITWRNDLDQDACTRELGAIEIEVPQPDLPKLALQPDPEYVMGPKGEIRYPAFEHVSVGALFEGGPITLPECSRVPVPALS